MKGTKITLKEFKTQFLEYARSRQCTVKTLRSYEHRIDKLLEYAPIANASLSDISPRVIAEFTRYALFQKQVSRATANRYLSILGNALRCAWKLGLVPFVPHVQRLKYESRERYVFSEADHRNWLDCSREPLKSMSALAMHTGMRPSEMLALRKDHVFLWDQPDQDRFSGEIVVCSAKRRSYRTLKLNSELRDMLRGAILQSECQHVFTSPADPGRPFSVSALAHQVSDARKKGAFAKGACLHALRVTFLMKLAQVASIDAVSWMAGHSSVRTTERVFGFRNAFSTWALKKVANRKKTPNNASSRSAGGNNNN